MMALLLNAVTEHCRSARGPSPDLAHVTLVEEAHRLLARAEGGQPPGARAREKAAEAFANALAENRKYGEGVILAGQFPARLLADAVKNSNLKLDAPADRRGRPALPRRDHGHGRGTAAVRRPAEDRGGPALQR